MKLVNVWHFLGGFYKGARIPGRCNITDRNAVLYFILQHPRGNQHARWITLL